MSAAVRKTGLWVSALHNSFPFHITNFILVAVGGTKGTLVLPYDYLQSVAEYVVDNFASSRSQGLDWASFVPNPFGIAVQDASVNFQDNIRAGMESGGVPTQFINDTSSCRIWYEPNMYFNVTSLWNKAAKVAFGGNNGTLDTSSCVSGSATSRDQQTGSGQGNSTSSGSGTGGGNKKNAAVSVKASGLQAVVLCSLLVALVSVLL